MRSGENKPQGFLSSYIRKYDESFGGGSYIVMNSTPRVLGGRPLLEIGYKYNYRKVIVFTANEGYGITEPDDPSLYRFPDIYSNFSGCPVFLTF